MTGLTDKCLEAQHDARYTAFVSSNTLRTHNNAGANEPLIQSFAWVAHVHPSSCAVSPSHIAPAARSGVLNVASGIFSRKSVGFENMM